MLGCSGDDGGEPSSSSSNAGSSSSRVSVGGSGGRPSNAGGTSIRVSASSSGNPSSLGGNSNQVSAAGSGGSPSSAGGTSNQVSASGSGNPSSIGGNSSQVSVGGTSNQVGAAGSGGNTRDTGGTSSQVSASGSGGTLIAAGGQQSTANIGGTATSANASSAIAGGPSVGCSPDAADAVQIAIATGDPRCVRLAPLQDALLTELDTRAKASCTLLRGMYGTNSIAYAPGNDTQFVVPAKLGTVTLLEGVSGNPLAIAGTQAKTRFAAFGSAPPSYFTKGENLTFEEPFTRLLEWLLIGDASSAAARGSTHTIATAHLHSSGGGDDTVAWLGKALPKWRVSDCNDNPNLATCFSGSELLIIGWDERSADADQVASAVSAAMKAGTAVLYLHTWYEGLGALSDRLSSLLGFVLPYGGNYWANDSASFTGVAETPQSGQMGCRGEHVSTVLQHLKKGDYSFDWSKCDDDVNCESVPNLTQEFYLGAREVRAAAAGLETRGQDPFTLTDDYLLEKMSILVGDKYRESIGYPMQQGKTSDTQLLGALLADHAALITRKINPAQPDLGTFSPKIRADYPTVSTTHTVATRAVDFVTSARAYALPGRTVTVTRTDAADASVSVRVNYLRDGTSHTFSGEELYSRPAFLLSSAVPLVANKPVNLTSPYGGILFLEIGTSSSPSNIAVSFSGVAQHPVYDGPGTEASFAKALADTELGWAELLTPALEVHSRMDLMKTTVANSEWKGDVTTLVGWTWTYLYQDVWGLAGFIGTDLTHPATVTAYCTKHGWDCSNLAVHGMRYVQHANMDHALMAYGTSGNPYDAYWAFSPLGWGDAHEIGHNLQRDRLKVYGDASTEVSNNIFPVHSRWRFSTEGVGQKYGWDLNFKGTYAMLQSAQKQANPRSAMYDALWVKGDLFQRLIFYWQLAMNNANVTILGDQGWDLYRLLYLAEREFDQAVDSDATWLAARDQLGFSSYSRDAATNLANGNDFMLVATSYITGRDHRPFFDIWGVDYSETAANQVASFGFAAAPLVYWVIPDEKAFSNPYSTPLPVDGTSTWPY
jgi:immunomodulating metalloprotease